MLDDFGSGLSSFNYLKHFPVDGIKVDGLFVKGVARNYLDYALVESIHKIGVSLGLQTIAEYVESEEIARKLAQIGRPRPGWLAAMHPGERPGAPPRSPRRAALTPPGDAAAGRLRFCARCYGIMTEDRVPGVYRLKLAPEA
jgi:predicted signal transduction protein with EAL and GGDEF domain